MTARASMMSPLNIPYSSQYIPSSASSRRQTGNTTTYKSSYGKIHDTGTRPPPHPTTPSYLSSTNTTTYKGSTNGYGTVGRTTMRSLRTVTSPRPLPRGRGPQDEYGHRVEMSDALKHISKSTGVSHVSNRYGSPIKGSHTTGVSTYTTSRTLSPISKDTTVGVPRSQRSGSVSNICAAFESINTKFNTSSTSKTYAPATNSFSHSKRFGSHADLSISSTNSTPRQNELLTNGVREDSLYDTGGSNKTFTKNYYNVNASTYDYSRHGDPLGSSRSSPTLPDIHRTINRTSRSFTRSPSLDRTKAATMDSPAVSRRASFSSRQSSISSMSPSHDTKLRPSPESSPSSSSMASRGLAGLRNLGNTCFMNSMLQCLANTTLLLEYCLQDEHSADINTSTSRMKGGLVKAYVKLMKQMWSGKGDSYITPTDFKSQIQKFAPRFMGYNQQDSQEFLIYLLEGLHEDVNRVTIKPKAIHTDSDGEEKISSSEKAKETWKRYLKRENSRIVDIFVGQLKSCLKCTVCGYASNTFDPLWQLTLPIKKKGFSETSLQACLELFTQEEVMDGDEKPMCARCKQRQKCTKSFSIQKFPKVLVIHLKRFSTESLFRSKLSLNVNFPVTDLDLSPYAAEKSASPILYNLFAVSNHSGTPISGHYTAYAKHPYTGEWHSFNDQRVGSVSTNKVVSSEGYVLFYELASKSSRL